MGTNTNVCLTQRKGRMGRRGDRRVHPGGGSHRVTGGQEQVRNRGKGSRYVERGKRGEEQADAHVGKSTNLVTLSSNKA